MRFPSSISFNRCCHSPSKWTLTSWFSFSNSKCKSSLSCSNNNFNRRAWCTQLCKTNSTLLCRLIQHWASPRCQGPTDNPSVRNFSSKCRCNNDNHLTSTSLLALWAKITSIWWCHSTSKLKEANRPLVSNPKLCCLIFRDLKIQMGSKDSRWGKDNRSVYRQVVGQEVTMRPF